MNDYCYDVAVTENRLIYLGNDFEMQDAGLLQSLGILTRNSESEVNPEPHLFLITTKFGKTVKKSIRAPSQKKSGQVEAYLLYRYLNDFELLELTKLSAANINFRILVVAHRFYNVNAILVQLIRAGITKERFSIITCKANQSRSFRAMSAVKLLNDSELSKKLNVDFLQLDRIHLTFNQNEAKLTNKSLISVTLPFILLDLLSFILNPLQLFKQSKFTWLNRIYEFFDFVFYLRYPIQKCFYLIQHSLIRLFYQLRHCFLMFVFKSWGLGVDVFFILKRWFYFGYYFVIGQRFIIAWIYHYLFRQFLFYPFRKACWFIEFQFDKRFRKKLNG